MSVDTDLLVSSIVQRLQTVDGVEAIALGGSRARGTHTLSSDIDLAIAYDPGYPLDLAALNHIAAELDDNHRPDLLTPLGGWGPWINGGGWLTVRNTPVDFLYRDLHRVLAVITDCRRGEIEVAYQPGHPFAFLSSIYMGEIAICKPLWDPHGTLSRLKSETRPFPRALKQALIDRFFWEADLSLRIAEKGLKRDDVTYVAGCCFRSSMCILQTLFALNEEYWLNEKGALDLAARFALAPQNLRGRVESAWSHIHPGSPSIQSAIEILNAIVHETAELLQHAGPASNRS